MDLKGAFDRVDRRLLWSELARIGIDEGLRMAVKVIQGDEGGNLGGR